MRRRNKWLLILGIVVVLLVAARLALEPILLDYANRKLNALNSYDGHIDDLDLSLLRGGYNVKGIEIVKTGSGQPVPFFKGERIEATIEWRSLLHGQLVAEADLFRPQANLVQAETEQQSQLGKEVNWVEQFKQLFPFRFNTVRVHDGTVTFRAPGIQTRTRSPRATSMGGSRTSRMSRTATRKRSRAFSSRRTCSTAAPRKSTAASIRSRSSRRSI